MVAALDAAIIAALQVLRLQQVVAAHVLDVAFAAERHGDIGLFPDDFEATRDAGFTTRTEAIEEGAAEI